MSAKAAVYLDANAGAPLRPEVREKLLTLCSDPFGFIANPSSIHSYGRRAKRLVSEARECIAFSLGKTVDPEQFVFTSSGTEANQSVIRSVFEPKFSRGEKPHWVTTPIEHDSNIQMVSWIRQQGGSVSFLPLDAHGVPETQLLETFLRPETILVSTMWVNSETGVIFDLSSASATCHRHQVPLHVDAAQAWGKLDIDLESLGAHFVTGSAHKIGALSGNGFLWLSKGNRLTPTWIGKQEKGRRAGSENVLGITAMGAAARTLRPMEWALRVKPLRDRLEKEILEKIPETVVNGGGAKRVANTFNLNFAGVEGESLVMAMDLAGYAVSSGSACSSGALEPSHVLLAMGRTPAQSMAALRISLVDALPWEVLEGFLQVLSQAVGKVRSAGTFRKP